MVNMTQDSEFPTLSEAEILRWIEDGFREYGPDPWLLIRELAQNSRDAGAACIHIRTGRDSRDREFLEFEDDGHGMSLDTARKYLFRFYSSSKENRIGTAGRFGIGFWSLWRFHPRLLVIQSSHHRKAWALEVDARFRVNMRPSPDLKKGTRIRMIRDAQFSDSGEFNHVVMVAARRYCSWLQRIRPHRGQLPVFVNGQRISTPLKPPGTPVKSFHGRKYRGAAALGEHPEVRLFSGGLPVWKGTSLEELGNGNNRQRATGISSDGLYPVIWMEISDLRVDLSRRHALHDSRLAEYRHKGERALSGLLNHVLDSAGARGRINRIRDLAEAMALRLRGRIWLQVILILVFLIPVEIGILNSLGSGRVPDSDPILNVNAFRYDGAEVALQHQLPRPPMLTYSPSGNHYFRLFAASKYHSEKGFIRSARKASPASAIETSSRILSVTLRTRGGATLALPHPALGEIDPHSMRWNGVFPSRQLRRGEGEYRLFLPPGGGELTYDCRVPGRNFTLSAREFIHYTQIPPHLLSDSPTGMELSRVAQAPLIRKVDAVGRIVSATLIPDSGAETSRLFSESLKTKWLDRVLEIGRGDCDVINGFAVLLLRKMQVPARLAVGWIAENGNLLPRLHAWAEYHDGSWRIMDLSGGTEPPAPREDSRAMPESSPPPGVPLWNIFFTFSTLLFLGILTILAIRVIRSRNASRQAHTQRGRDHLLSRMALGALLFPRQWGMKSRLWTSGLLPLLNGRRLSLYHALKRGHRGGLYSARPDNPLAQRNRHLILDRDRTHFLPIYRLVHGIVDLDRIHALGTTPFQPGHPDLDPLILRLHKLGKRMGKIGFTVAEGKSHKPSPPTWLDLTLLNIYSPRFWRRPVLLLSTTDPEYLAISRLYARHPGKAVYKLLRNALYRATIMTRTADEILEAVSRDLLGEGF